MGGRQASHGIVGAACGGANGEAEDCGWLAADAGKAPTWERGKVGKGEGGNGKCKPPVCTRHCQWSYQLSTLSIRVESHMIRIAMLVGLVCGLVPHAAAAPYWVAWEGNDYPENEGWQRIVNGPQPDERTLADGIMTMDGLADRQIDDYYRLQRPLNPGPGERFVMQWRVRVHEVVGSPLALYDAGFGLFSDDDWALLLVFGVDFIRSFHEEIEIPFVPGEFHAFELTSDDMHSYDLSIDGSLAYSGSLWEPSTRRSRIEWGDISRGSASLVDWDYFRFGVVPEPGTSGLVACLICALVGMRRR